MEVSVEKEKIKDFLQAAKNQFISVSICNHSGAWSQEYRQVQDIREFKHGSEKFTIVILCSLKDSECTATDGNFISGIKFDKYLNIDGHLFDQIIVKSKESLLQLSH
jgi:hypothetical protein